MNARRATLSDRVGRLTWLAAALAVVAAGYVLYFHYRVIVHTGPIEYREGAIVITTDLLLHGGDPYALKNLPTYTNVYGILFNWTVLPVAQIVGNGFVVHRAVNAVFVLGALALILVTLRRMRVGLWLAGVAVVMLYADLAARMAVTPSAIGTPTSTMARPDALGMLLFLASVLIPWRYRFSHRSMLAGCILAVLAFFAKPYFVIGLPLVAAYVFLFKSKSRGLIWSGVFLALFGGAFAFACLRHDSYYEVMVKANAHSFQPKASHLWAQLWVYLTATPGTFVLLFAAVAIEIARVQRTLRINGVNVRKLGAILPLNGPLFAMPVDYLWYLLIACGVIVFGRLGWHVGSAMSYFYQLFTPFVLLVVYRSLRRWGRFQSVAVGLILLDLVLLLSCGLSPAPVNDPQGWAEWRTIIAASQRPYVGAPLAWIAAEQGKPIQDNGMSEFYVFFALPYPATPFEQQMVEDYAQRRRDLAQAVREQQFDVILYPLASGTPCYSLVKDSLVKEYYRESRRVEIPMAWSPDIEGAIFVPKHAPTTQSVVASPTK